MRLRPYQRQCNDAVYSYFNHETGNPLVVVPTGGGKSLVIGSLCREILEAWPKQRILVLSHVKELIAQNYEKIMTYWPGAPAGVYSASLGMRQFRHPIVVATVQSVYKKADILGHRDLCFVDEAHLVQNAANGMYRFLLSELKRINPLIKIVGFSATPYRLDSGVLYEGESRIFDAVAIDIPILTLIEDGYLTRPIGKSSLIQANMKDVGLVAGEFNSKQMAAAFDVEAFTNAALDEVITLAAGRKSIAMFCASIEHAQHVAEGMRARGIYTEMVNGEMKADERDDKLRRFKSGKMPCLSSVGIVTTGFDAPNIDCIVMLRATMSPGLYLQIVGRGSRVIYAPGHDMDTQEGRLAAIATGHKPNFLVLDYGGNIERHGPITEVKAPEKRNKKKKEDEDKPKVKICDLCRTAWPLGTIECAECGNSMVQERDLTKNLEAQASHLDILKAQQQAETPPEWMIVHHVAYHQHKKPGSPDSMRVEYACGMKKYNEWICFDHRGFARSKAEHWWKKRDNGQIPGSTLDALAWARMINTPVRILVRKNGKYHEVIDYEFRPAQEIAIA